METFKTTGGGRIFRHDEPRIPPGTGKPDLALLEEMMGHVSAWLSPSMKVMSARNADPIHLSWIFVGPDATRPFSTVITVGMGSAPMMHPEYRNGRPLWGEVFILMPPEWRFDPSCTAGNLANWPFDLTGDLARMPHQFDTILWSGHTFQYANPPGPLFPGLPFHGAVLCETDMLPRDFHVLPIRPGKEIRLHCVLPIYAAELRYAEERGGNELIDRLARAGVPDVVDCSRACVCS